MQLRFLIAIALASVAVAGEVSAASDCANQDPFYWQGNRRLPVYDKLMPLMTCADYGQDENNASADSTACNWFAARGLQAWFGVNDVVPQGGKWQTANQIASLLSSSPKWQYLGKGYDQAAMKAAGDAASAGSVVVAAMTGASHGHLAIVLAGPLEQSGKWGLAVPNSA